MTTQETEGLVEMALRCLHERGLDDLSDAVEARIQALEADLLRSQQETRAVALDEALHRAETSETEASSLKARVKELEEGLEPFARAFTNGDGKADEMRHWVGSEHFRKARSLLPIEETPNA